MPTRCRLLGVECLGAALKYIQVVTAVSQLRKGVETYHCCGSTHHPRSAPTQNPAPCERDRVT